MVLTSALVLKWYLVGGVLFMAWFSVTPEYQGSIERFRQRCIDKEIPFLHKWFALFFSHALLITIWLPLITYGYFSR